MAGPTTSATLTASLQRHYSKDLLDRMLPVLVFADHALKTPLPGKSGAKTIRLFRFDIPTAANVQTPAEGTPMANTSWRQLTLETVDADLVQYIQTIGITDIADATSLFDLLGQANIQNSEDAALHCDAVTQYELVQTSGVVGGVDYATKNYIYAQAATNYTGVYAGGVVTPSVVFNANDLLDAATILKINKTPKINGAYVMAAPPQITRDIMAGSPANSVWVAASAYSAVQQLFNGEVGKLYGIRVVEHNNPYRSAAVAPGANPKTNEDVNGIVHHALIFGRNAYGLPDLKTLGSPYAPAVFIVTGADKSDPANQIRALVSWKAYWAAKLLQPKWIAHLITQSGIGS